MLTNAQKMKNIQMCNKIQNKGFTVEVLKYLFHETNYVLGKHYLRSAKKRCTLYWNPGPILITLVYIITLNNIIL